MIRFESDQFHSTSETRAIKPVLTQALITHSKAQTIAGEARTIAKAPVRKPVELAARLQANRSNIQKVEAKAPAPKISQQPIEVPAKLCIAPTADGRYTVKVAWAGKHGAEERSIIGLDPQYVAQTVISPTKPKAANALSSADLDGRGRRAFWKIQDGHAERYTA